ncbi:hypothetical protein HPG69_018709, partial [Diceros bicornis minor]
MLWTLGLQLRSRFGDVFSLQLGWSPVVVVSGLAAIREALVDQSEDTADRPPMPVFEHLGFGPHAQGKRRRGGPLPGENLARGDPRPAGPSGGRVVDLRSREESANLKGQRLEEGACAKSGEVDAGGAEGEALLGSGTKNCPSGENCRVMWAGRGWDRTQPEGGVKWAGPRGHGKDRNAVGGVVNAIPVLLHIPGLVNKVFPGQRAFMALLNELVAEHRMTRDPAQPPRDLTDAFLDEVEKAKRNPETSFNDENLRLVVADLFFAGMVSTSTTLAWALLLMILHPDAQRFQASPPAHTPFMPGISCQGTMLFTNLSSVLKDET